MLSRNGGQAQLWDVSPIRSIRGTGRGLGHPTRLRGQVKRVVRRRVLLVGRRRHGQARRVDQLLMLLPGRRGKEPAGLCIRCDPGFRHVAVPGVDHRPPTDARPADPGVLRERVRRRPRRRLRCRLLKSVQKSRFRSRFAFCRLNLQIEMLIGAHMRRTFIPHLKPILNTSKF